MSHPGDDDGGPAGPDPRALAVPAGTGATIADRLRQARRRGFVGRAAELDLVRAALAAPEPPFSVLFLHGPSGSGKTALLGAFAQVAEEAGACPVHLDARTADPTPEGMLAVLDAAPADRRAVLLVDTYEAVPHLDGWFRDALTPALPARTLLVIASRVPPPPGWTADVGWRRLVHARALPDLPREDAHTLLRLEGVPEDLHEPVLAATHGHPLALILLAEVVRQDPAADLDLRYSPDVVCKLVERFAADAPSPRHREALHVCARARHTTEPLLAQVMGRRDAAELFAWLRGLSFVEQGPLGVLPHDLVREVMDEDLRWRDPAAHHELTWAVRAHLRGLITATQDREQHHWIAETMYLLRSTPGFGGDLDWTELGHAYADDYEPRDRPAVLAMVDGHEGGESAALAARWLDHPAATVVVLRGPAEPEALGFAMVLDAHRLGAEEVRRDPATAAALAGIGEIRSGEEVVLSRFFMDRTRYQERSVARTAFMARQAQHLLSRPGLAFALVTCRTDAASAMALLTNFNYTRAPQGEFTVGRHSYATFFADCREHTPEEWVGGLVDQAGGGSPAVTALTKERFAAAAREALRHFHRSDLLAANPLLSARLAGARPTVEALREAVHAAVRSLAADPREEHFSRAVDRTYLHPARNQEAAAQDLGLPFSTYRRHLTRGVERTVALLWHQESIS